MAERENDVRRFELPGAAIRTIAEADAVLRIPIVLSVRMHTPSKAFWQSWRQLRAQIQSHLNGIEVESWGSERTLREHHDLRSARDDAENWLRRADALVPFVAAQLEAVDDAIGNALDILEPAKDEGRSQDAATSTRESQ